MCVYVLEYHIAHTTSVEYTYMYMKSLSIEYRAISWVLVSDNRECKYSYLLYNNRVTSIILRTIDK
jgi:hypothetical protein